MNKAYSVHHRNNVNIFVSNPMPSAFDAHASMRAGGRAPSHTCIIRETIIHASAFVWQIYCVDNANSLPTHGIHTHTHTRISALSDCDETTCSFSMRQRCTQCARYEPNYTATVNLFWARLIDDAIRQAIALNVKFAGLLKSHYNPYELHSFRWIFSK